MEELFKMEAVPARALQPSTLLLSRPPFWCKPVTLVFASGLVRLGHFNQTSLQCGLQVDFSEIFSI
jgi:hypothetical protein